MDELGADRIGETAPLMEPFGDRFPSEALADGSLGSRLFVDSRECPTAAFAWTEVGYYYLAGNAGHACVAKELGSLLADELIPAARALGETMPMLYLHPLAWKQHLGTLTGGGKTFQISRRRFQFNSDRFREMQSRLPDLPSEFHLVRLAAERGPLVRVLRGDEVVAECGTAVSAGKKREIGIHTVEGYRQRGLATAAAATLIDHCLAHDWEPCWECFSDNLASCRTAERLGFCEPADYPVWAWRLP